MYKCPACGSEMRFDPSRQKLYCDSCGRELDPQDTSPADSAITPEQAMAVHQAADSEEEEITPARRRYEAYLAKKAGQTPEEYAPEESVSNETVTSPKNDPAAKTTVKTAAAHRKSTGNSRTSRPDSAPKSVLADRPTYKAHVFVCPNCGAELLSGSETVATFCSYCGSSVLLESRIADASCPDYVIPFRVTKESCEAAYRRMLRRALFVPDEMKDDTQIERFRGIYMPYWIYSFEQDGPYRVSGSKSRRRGDYVYTKHYRLESHLKASCKGLSYDASSTFADNLSAAIAPFDSQARTEFTPEYLSGFYADRGDVDSEVYYNEACSAARRYVAAQADENSIYRKYNASQDTMARSFSPKRTSAELGMFPVWFLGCRSHDGKRISYAVVNGQTGKAAADLPIDPRKYLLGSLALAVPLFLLLNLFLTLTPTKALIFAVVLALFSFFLSNRQLNRIYTRDHQLDDMGLQSVKQPRSSKTRSRTKTQPSSGSISGVFLRILKLLAVMWGSMIIMGVLLSLGIFRSFLGSVFLMITWFVLMCKMVMSITAHPRTSAVKTTTIYSAPMREKWGSLYKPLLAIAICLVILIWNPVSDLFYYIGAVVALCCVIWSFFDIIREHNLLTTRKLPQMGKRGGDENA